MRHDAHQLLRRIAGELRVAVQDDDVLGIAQASRIADDRVEARRLSAERGVQLLELASLPLPSHPYALALVDAAAPVEQIERAGRRRPIGIAGVQGLDAFHGPRQERVVTLHLFTGRVPKIADEDEGQAGIAIGEEANLHGLEQVIDLVRIRQHRGHGDHGPVLGGNSPRKVEARQDLRANEQGHRPVQQGDRQLAGGDQQYDDRGAEPPTAKRVVRGCQQEASGDGHSRQGERRGVDGEDRARAHPAEPRRPRPPRRDGSFERGPAGVQQEVAHVGPEILGGPGKILGRAIRTRSRFRRQLDGAASDVVLRGGAALRDLFDGAAILIARREVHGRIDAGGIGAKGRVHDAHALDEGSPVRRAQQPKAADVVSDRHLVLGLALADDPEYVLDGLSALRKALLQPRDREKQRRALALKARRKLCDERVRQRWIRFDHLGEH